MSAGSRSPRPERAGALGFLSEELDVLRASGLLRGGPALPDESELVLCSNDYLGYAAKAVRGASLGALGEFPVGSGASRLVAGEHPAHGSLERALAEWVGLPEALLFTSGYAANVGLLSSVMRRGDAVVSDALNHASIIDGCRLSGAEIRVYPHLDLAQAAELLALPTKGRRWLVTESYFSMDGDSPDLPAARAMCDAAGAGLFVDEAHGIGVFGPSGSGLCAASGVVPDALVGTLGKALGAQGAFVAGTEGLVGWLWNRARSFVFSTGMSPLLAALGLDRVRRAQADDAARERLREVAEELRTILAGAGRPAVPGFGPVLPVLVGEADEAVRLTQRLRSRGVFVQAIRPPTVPVGTSRLRFTARADLTVLDIAHARTAVRQAFN